MSVFNKVTILSLALLVSLCVNVGLVSYMAGRQAATTVETADGGTAPRPAAGAALTEIIRDMPAEQRQAIRRVVAERRPETRQAVLALQDQRRDIAEMLKEDRLDEAAVNSSLAELRARTTAAQVAGHRFLMEIVPHLSAQQRRDLIERQRNLVR